MRKNYLTGLAFALTLPFVLLASSLTVSAQVTIGSGIAPNTGALLDLKQETTTTKGLGMPRVELTMLAPTGTDLKETINGATGTTVWDLDEHIGLAVYNVAKIETAANRVCPGLHVWDGEAWQPLQPYADVQEQKTLVGLTSRGFEYLDENSPASDFPGTTTAANYPLGALGTFPDNRTGTAENYNMARFYVGYKTGTANYNIQRSYNCDATAAPAWVNEGTEAVTGRLSFEDGVWMTENLRATVKPDNSSMTYNAANNTTTPYYYYPNNAVANVATMGVLYNWPAAINMGTGSGQTPDPGNVAQGGSTNTDVRIQGICPDGWYLPADQEYTDLENGMMLKTSTFSTTPDIGTSSFLSYDQPAGWAGAPLGTAMKSTTPANGTATATNGTSKANTAGGFDVRLAGVAGGGSAYNYGAIGYFWSASSGNSTGAWCRYVNSGSSQVGRSATSRYYLFSVRCKK